jgi:chaperonin cofactor prefoldin
VALVYVYSLEKRTTFANVNDIVVLSPAMYWFKVCEIPTKSMTKAKKIAIHMMSNRPANFEGITLFYKTDSYHAYTYNKRSITTLIKELGLKNPKVYFANQLALTEITAIDDETNLYKFNQTVIESHATTQKPSKSLSIHYEELLQGEKPMLSFESGDRSLKTVLSLSAGVFLLYIMLFTFDKVSILNSIENEMENLNIQNRSFYQIRSLIKKYTKLDQKSEQLKEKLTQVLKDENLKSLTYSNGTFEVKK